MRLEFVVAPGIPTPELCQARFPGSRLALGCLCSSWTPFTAPRRLLLCLKSVQDVNVASSEMDLRQLRGQTSHPFARDRVCANKGQSAIPALVPTPALGSWEKSFPSPSLLYFLKVFFQTKRESKIGLGRNFFKVEQF